MKRMMHPLHGFHHAMNTLEEETMRKNGWVDDAPPKSAGDDHLINIKTALASDFAGFTDVPAKRTYNRKVK